MLVTPRPVHSARSKFRCGIQKYGATPRCGLYPLVVEVRMVKAIRPSSPKGDVVQVDLLGLPSLTACPAGLDEQVRACSHHQSTGQPPLK